VCPASVSLICSRICTFPYLGVPLGGDVNWGFFLQMGHATEQTEPQSSYLPARSCARLLQGLKFPEMGRCTYASLMLCSQLKDMGQYTNIWINNEATVRGIAACELATTRTSAREGLFHPVFENRAHIIAVGRNIQAQQVVNSLDRVLTTIYTWQA